MKFGRTDRLSPAEREIVDRFERGVVDAMEAGRLLIASVQRVEPVVSTEPDETAEDEHLDETPEEATARELVERLAREAYGDESA